MSGAAARAFSIRSFIINGRGREFNIRKGPEGGGAASDRYLSSSPDSHSTEKRAKEMVS